MVTIAERRTQKTKELQEKKRDRQIVASNKRRSKIRKPPSKISQKRKQKSDYVKVCCQTFGVSSKKELRSVLSGKLGCVVHHIWGRTGKLRDDPYNLMPLTREEHEEHHRNRTFETKTKQSILLRKAIENAHIYSQMTTYEQPAHLSKQGENEVLA